MAKLKSKLLILSFSILLLMTPVVYANSYVISTNVYFGFMNGYYIKFNQPQILNRYYLDNGYWYFDGYGFRVHNANMTITSFFETSGKHILLIFDLIGETGKTGIANIYVGGLGCPISVTGADTWNYSGETRIVSVAKTFSSGATITLVWVGEEKISTYLNWTMQVLAAFISVLAIFVGVAAGVSGLKEVAEGEKSMTDWVKELLGFIILIVVIAVISSIIISWGF